MKKPPSISRGAQTRKVSLICGVTAAVRSSQRRGLCASLGLPVRPACAKAKVFFMAFPFSGFKMPVKKTDGELSQDFLTRRLQGLNNIAD